MDRKFRRELINTAHKLEAKKLVAGSWGNISVKFKDEMIVPSIAEDELLTVFGKTSSVKRVPVEAILITPSGLGYENMQDDDLVLIDAEGKVLEGKHVPSSESKLHTAIYKACPEAGAIIHTHSIYASALAAMHKSVPAIIEDLVQIIGGRVECAEYALPGTQELADNAVKALHGKKACLLANHGAVAWGKTLADALMVAEILEKTAQIAIICMQAGGAYELTQEDADVMHDFYNKHYGKRQLGEE
ncbi:MAG: class II aldolase/adducin family protein [Phascolarctobacterium sp.]|nr:class II aldolase/adducin family protein [Phascolarctobacterium sp.]